MKKLITVLFIALCFFGCSQTKSYKVDYICGIDCFSGAKDSYKAGETVKLTFPVVATDTDYTFFIDGKSVSYDRENEGIVLTFTMPEHEITVDYSSQNSMIWKENVLEEIRDEMYPSLVAISFLGEYYSETEFQEILDFAYNDLGYNFMYDFDSNHLVQVYEEGVYMQVYLVVPAFNASVTVSKYDFEMNEVGDIIYKDEYGDAFLLVFPDTYGNPSTVITIVGDYMDCTFCPALELTTNDIRTGMSQAVWDMTSEAVQCPNYLQSRFDALCEVDEVRNSGKTIKELWDMQIDGRYCAVFGVGDEPENSGNYYAVKPGTYEIYKSSDFSDWKKIK